jgi:hypothetical protein
VLVFASIAALAISVGVGGASAQTTTTVSKLGPHDCGEKKVSILFWASGHGPSTQYSFPAFPVPHVEVYKAAPYQNADFLAYFDVKGDPAYVAACAPGSASAGRIASIKSPKKQTANALLQCSYPKAATIEIVPGTTSSAMNVVSNKQMVTTIVLGQTSSTATYNSKYCTSKPPIA